LNDWLRVQLRPSRTLAIALAVGHLLALIAATIGLPTAAASLVVLGLGLSLFHHLRLAIHRSALAVAALAFSADGRFAVADPAGAWVPAELRHGAVPAAWLAVLAARDHAGRSRTTVILPDAADPEDFRRLRVWLKWRISSPADGRDGAITNGPG
jgi:toxin CptA